MQILSSLSNSFPIQNSVENFSNFMPFHPEIEKTIGEAKNTDKGDSWSFKETKKDIKK